MTPVNETPPPGPLGSPGPHEPHAPNGVGWGGAKQPPPPSAIDSVLPPVDSRLSPAPPPSRDAYLALLISIILEATVPSLQCYWGVLLVCWFSPSSATNPLPTPMSLLDLRNAGFIWTPVLFSASWSVTDPWSETLSAVHGHPRMCSLVGAILLTGGMALAALGAAISPSSPFLPLLSGLTAGIAAGVGASLLSRSARLVLGQRWGVRVGLTEASRRFLRALGLSMAPLAALPLCQRLGPGGALSVAALACFPALIAPFVLALPKQNQDQNHEQQEQPSKYERLKDAAWQVSVHRNSGVDIDVDVQTEVSDDGGSVSEYPPPSTSMHGSAEVDVVDVEAGNTTTVVAEVHCDESGARQQPGGPGGPGGGLTLNPAATARLASVTPSAGVAEVGENPRPLYGEGGTWNLAYSFDCDGDDDIELFVRRLSPRQGPVTRFCAGVGWYCRGCRADLRPVLRPSFHLSLYTLLCCRLANLALPVLLPALAVVQMGARARIHLMAALPAVAGVGAMLFGLTVLWETAAEDISDTGPTRPRSRRRFLSVVAAQTAVGFLLLSWGRSQWWLMLGCLGAGYGCAGATWAQRHAVVEAMGGATAYRAQPLLSFSTGLITVLLPLLCGLELTRCMAILSGMYAALSGFWLLQPYLVRFC